MMSRDINLVVESGGVDVMNDADRHAAVQRRSASAAADTTSGHVT